MPPQRLGQGLVHLVGSPGLSETLLFLTAGVGPDLRLEGDVAGIGNHLVDLAPRFSRELPVFLQGRVPGRFVLLHLLLGDPLVLDRPLVFGVEAAVLGQPLLDDAAV